MKKKAIGLLSGGLDSSIAFKIMKEFDLEILALNFMSPFCTCNRKNGENGNGSCKNIALSFAKKEEIPIKVLHLGEDYIEMIRHPKHGYGKNINPCLDCRILMFSKARKILEEIGAEFIFTGEVLGQRPMSQRRDTFNVIERESNLRGLIVRPLSAKLLPPTIPEINGLIDREKMMRLSGRSRKPQIQAANTYGIHDYPCPAGGCLLTEANFSRRVKDLFSNSAKTELKDIETLKIGRHFRLSPNCKVIVGRDEKENIRLEKILKNEDYFFRVKDYQGPLVMGRGTLDDNLISLISQIAVRYSDAPKTEKVTVNYKQVLADKEENITATAISESILSEWRI